MATVNPFEAQARLEKATKIAEILAAVGCNAETAEQMQSIARKSAALAAGTQAASPQTWAEVVRLLGRRQAVADVYPTRAQVKEAGQAAVRAEHEVRRQPKYSFQRAEAERRAQAAWKHVDGLACLRAEMFHAMTHRPELAHYDAGNPLTLDRAVAILGPGVAPELLADVLTDVNLRPVDPFEGLR